MLKEWLYMSTKYFSPIALCVDKEAVNPYAGNKNDRVVAYAILNVSLGVKSSLENRIVTRSSCTIMDLMWYGYSGK